MYIGTTIRKATRNKMEGFFAGIVEELFANLLFIPIGFAYLWLRYRNQVRVRETLAKEYENSYANMGRAFVLNTIAAIGIGLAVGALMVAPLLHWLKN